MDIDKLTQSINDAAAKAVSAALEVARYEWIGAAQERLKTTRRDFIEGLNQADSVIYPDGAPTCGSITLRGNWPQMIETGFSSFDIKRGLLSSPKAKQGKNGPYITVPMRHGTPGAISYKPMPKDVYGVASKLQPGQKLSMPGTNYDGMVKMGTKGHAQYMTFRRVSAVSDASSWTHPGFEGLKAFEQVRTKTETVFQDLLSHELEQLT